MDYDTSKIHVKVFKYANVCVCVGEGRIGIKVQILARESFCFDGQASPLWTQKHTIHLSNILAIHFLIFKLLVKFSVYSQCHTFFHFVDFYLISRKAHFLSHNKDKQRKDSKYEECEVQITPLIL